MPAQLLDGKVIAAQIETELQKQARQLCAQFGRTPKLAAVLLGDDPASQVYVRNKRRACGRVGIDSELFRLASDTRLEELLALIERLNGDATVNGILVQLPLAPGMDATIVLDTVDPWKDVDAFHPENVGLILQGRPRFVPCTPQGVLQILHWSKLTTAGKHVVIVGRSDIVGKPLAALLMQRTSMLGRDWANATVTLCHTQTSDLAAITRLADILIVAVGRPRAIDGAMIRRGATVIDVGINRTESGLVGDVDFDSARDVAGYLTPVPGGVGPLTICMLLQNTLTAARLQWEKS
jgi:methylenetetrahydrofolate dehydrogenase (NADP+) / methenyltetrahydrofolate cyclohydrolase